MMPIIDGLDVCRILRAESDVAILLLTARTTEDDVLLGLDVGADDYITKPYSPRELTARVRALLRRAGVVNTESQAVLRVGDLEVDPGRFEVRVAGRSVTLTAKEFGILEVLAAEPGRAFTRAQIIDRAFGFDHFVLERTVDAHVMNLRRKIETHPTSPRYVQTVFGRGYRLAAPRPRSAGPRRRLGPAARGSSAVSFRLRLLLLVVLVAVTATVATAWLTLRQASQQIVDSAAADQTQVDLVTEQLTRYGQEHGTWAGVVDLVQDLRARTGQRIHVVTESGEVLVDTDTEEGRPARPLGSSSAIVDPRPILPLTVAGPDAEKATAKAIIDYRHTARNAACLTARGIRLSRSSDHLGLPRFAPAAHEQPNLKEILLTCEGTATLPSDGAEASRQVQVCLKESQTGIGPRAAVTAPPVPADATSR
jgi:DNA-binding response OmpR family regulator